ncbi:MAG: D-alanine--D-alanine ligase family protein [Patescibacteria group bacterium]
MKKLTIGIFFGGQSPEHEVSLMSAKNVIAAIDRKRFKVREFWIDKKGRFWTGIKILVNVEKKEFKNLKSADLNTLNRQIDVAFPVLHGQGGEDGTIQGMFRMLNIPFVGADVLSSSLCLDKGVFNELMQYHGLPKPKFVIIDYQRQATKEIKKNHTQALRLKYPVFVKPACTGSSVGITKVKERNDLGSAIKFARKYDVKVIIEESVENCLEIEVAVSGNSIDNFKIAKPGRIVPSNEFYDYNDKYIDGKSYPEIPANLPQKTIKEIKRLALEAYRIANCEGMARVDFLVKKNGKIYLNEINTIPGFTAISMYPKMWQASGLSYKNLITKLIELALQRKKH